MSPTPPDPPPADDPMSLDFTVPGAFCVAPATPAAPPLPSAFEQALRLNAAGDAAAACRLLEAAVHDGADFGAAGEETWGLLLDLYQATGQRETFEAQALEFARHFEKSPPAWVERAAPAAAPAAEKIVGASLAGKLNARVAEPLQQLLKVCIKTPVRIDVARIADADERGCELLLAALETCRRTRARCLLAGAGQLAALLDAKAHQGGSDQPHVWLLLLHLYQRLGREAAFEEAAIDYAVRFEVSPPSWDKAHIGECEN